MGRGIAAGLGLAGGLGLCGVQTQQRGNAGEAGNEASFARVDDGLLAMPGIVPLALLR
jgi:hypothetical protein